MGKKFGALWHCVMGDGFGFELTYEVKHLMYLHFFCGIHCCIGLQGIIGLGNPPAAQLW